MRLAVSLFVPALLASVSAHAVHMAPAADATLTFVSPEAAFIGNAFGMDAVDDRMLVLDSRSYTKVASGVRTIRYACPDAVASAVGSYLTHDFEAGKHYELVCSAGRQATIRESDSC